MDPRQQCAHHSLCITCRTERTGNLTIRGVSPLGRFLILALSLSLCIAEVSMQPATETLCGGELVDTLQFVCGERGFYFSRPHPRGGRRFQGGIVEECCFRSCALELLEQYCAKPTVTERDLSRHIMPAAHTETINRAYPVRLSLWPRQSIQRLRRGVPAAKSRALRRALLAEGYRASEDGALHRPLGGVGVGVGGGGSLLEGRSLKDGHQSIRPVPLLHRRSPHSHQEEDEEEAAIMALLGYRPSRLHGRKDARRRRPLTELFQTHTARK